MQIAKSKPGSTGYWSRLLPIVQKIDLVPLLLWISLWTGISRFTSLTSGFAIDDYVYFFGSDSLVPFSLSEGRWGSAAIFGLIDVLGVNPIGASVVFGLLNIFAFSVFITVVIQILFPSMPKLLQALGGAVIVTHPYWAELYTFKISYLGATVSFAALAIAFSIALRRPKLWGIPNPIPFLLFLFVISIGQANLNLVATVVFSGIALSIARRYPVRLRESNTWATCLRLLFSLVAATLAYGALLLLQSMLTANNSSRVSLVGLDDIPGRGTAVATQIGYIFVGDEPIFPLGAKLIFTLMVLASVSVWAFRVLRIRSIVRTITFVTLVTLSPLLIIGVVIVVEAWWPVPRVLQHVALLFGLFFLIGLDLVRPIAVKAFLVSLGLISTFVGLALNAQVFADQRAINQLDHRTASLMISEIRNQSDITDIRTLVFSGSFWTYENRLQTVQGDLNISAFGAPWSQRKVVEYATGKLFENPKSEDISLADEICLESASWPETGSVHVLSDVAIICLAIR